MNEYELLYIVSPRLNPEEANATVEAIGAGITSVGGEILSVDNWGRRRLAYPIKHHFEGTYVLTTMKIDPQATAELDRVLRIREDVLRHLLVAGIIEGLNGPPELELTRESRRPMPAAPPAPRAEEASAEPATDAVPSEAPPADTAPAEGAPAAAAPTEGAAVDAAPVEAAPADAVPTEGAAPDGTPAVETAASDAAPVETADADAVPTEEAVAESAPPDAPAAEPSPEPARAE